MGICQIAGKPPRTNLVNLALTSKRVPQGKPILENTRKRLLAIDPTYPVEYLRVKLDFTLAATEIDQVKKSVAMAGAGIYTYDECRAVTKHPKLHKEQYGQLVRKGATIGADGEYEDPEPKYPDTPQSRNQRPTGVGMSKAEKSTSSSE